MLRKASRASLLPVILALALMGGGYGPDNSAPRGGLTIPTTDSPITLAGSPPKPDTPKTCDSDEVCFSYEEMRDAINHAMQFVAPFFQAMMKKEERPGFPYVSTGKTRGTLCGPVDAAALHYCTGDRSVYMGQDALWEIYNSPRGGDAGIALALAHELGHHLQTLARVPKANTSREKIHSENQADCVAGAWVVWADAQGYFVAGEEEEILGTLEAIASVEGVNREHGTRSEREEALAHGLLGGIAKCSEYFPQYPLR